jgi:hypothetical protein
VSTAQTAERRTGPPVRWGRKTHWDSETSAESQTHAEPAGSNAIAPGRIRLATVICRSFVSGIAPPRLPENRGVPGSSPGLAIGRSACKIAGFVSDSPWRFERQRATVVRKVLNEVLNPTRVAAQGLVVSAWLESGSRHERSPTRAVDADSRVPESRESDSPDREGRDRPVAWNSKARAALLRFRGCRSEAGADRALPDAWSSSQAGACECRVRRLLVARIAVPSQVPTGCRRRRVDRWKAPACSPLPPDSYVMAVAVTCARVG